MTRIVVSRQSTVFVLNSMMVPLDPEVEKADIRLRKATVQEVAALLSKNPFVSAVGHEATAQLLTALLGVEIPMRRVQVEARPGDTLVLFRLHARLPEGFVLQDKEQLDAIGYDLYIAEIKPSIQLTGRRIASVAGVDIELVARNCNVSHEGDELRLSSGKGVLLRFRGMFEALNVFAPHTRFDLPDACYIYIPRPACAVEFYLDTHYDHGIYSVEVGK